MLPWLGEGRIRRILLSEKRSSSRPEFPPAPTSGSFWPFGMKFSLMLVWAE
jgi:hypothetical protein